MNAIAAETAPPQAERKIDWGRIEQSIRQRFRREPGIRANVPKALEALKRLAPKIGPQSQGRRALRNIGIALTSAVEQKSVTVISPICLYIPAGELGPAKPSVLVERHVDFMSRLWRELPSWKLVCLFPPPEREDARAEAYIRETLEATRERYRWETRVKLLPMSTFCPGMIAEEETVIEEIWRTPYLSRLCDSLMSGRIDYYRSIGIESRLWDRRTRRTMAQYIILGRIAALNGYLMCNHTSANIMCAQYAGGGVLHDPVGFR